MGNRLATIGLKSRVCCAPFREASASSSNTVLPWPRPTSVPGVNGISIYPAVRPQQTRAENWGTEVPLWGELGAHVTQCGLGRGLPPYRVAS